MTNKKTALLTIIAIILGINTQLFAISLEEFIILVKTKHPLYQQLTLLEKESTLQIPQAEERFNTLLEQDLSYTRTNPIKSSPFNPDTIDTSNFKGTISKELQKTGGKISIGINSQYNYFGYKTPPSLNGTPLVTSGSFYQNSIFLSYIHPLLKNINGTLSKLGVEIATLKVEEDALKFKEAKETLLKTMIQNYIEWTFLYEENAIIANRIDLSENLLQSIRRQYEANLLNKVDVLRAEDSLNTLKEQQLIIRNKLENKGLELEILLSEKDLRKEKPTFSFYKVNAPSKKETSETRTQKQLLFIQKILEKELNALKNEKKPELDLVTKVAINDGNKSSNKSLNFENNEASIALTYKNPLSKKSDMAKINAKELELEAIKLQLEEVKQIDKSTFTQLNTSIRQWVEIIELNKNQLQSSKLKTDEEWKLYTQGRNSLSTVLQARDQELTAKLNYLNNLLTFHFLKYNLLDNQDILEE